MSVVLAGLFWHTDVGIYLVVFSIIVINVGKPFIRAATFAITPKIANPDSLYSVNNLSASFVQARQLAGVALVGIILQYFDVGIAFIIDGIIYIVAAILILLLKVKKDITPKDTVESTAFALALFKEWIQFLGSLSKKRKVLVNIIVSSGDFISVTAINLALVPLIIQRFDNNYIWLAILDGCFALGALMNYVVSKKFNLIERWVGIGLVVQTFCFF